MRISVSWIGCNSALAVEISADASFSDLRRIVFAKVKELKKEHLDFPAIFYAFLVGDRAVADHEKVCDLSPEGSQVLHVTLVVSLARLEGQDEDVRVQALQALDEFVMSTDSSAAKEKVVNALHVFFDDSQPQIRRLALKIAGEFATPDNELVIAAALSHIEKDDEQQVVCTALDTLAKLVVLGSDAERNDRIVETVQKCLQSANARHGEDVTFSSVHALGAFARCGHRRAIESLGVGLSDPNGYIRLLALDVLGASKIEHDPSIVQLAVELVAARAEDQDGKIRLKALEVLATLAPRGDARGLSTASAHVCDSSEAVRRAALVALAKLGKPGSPEVISAVCSCIAEEDPGSDVRCVALDVLGDLAQKGCEQAIAAAELCADDPSDDVQEAARDLLSMLAESDA
eukprot:TRINITY_DN32263_c0_g1_i1.p1 TRINITY_DN32263_c0_g1~~TRINITY_DN32263_c0_g1_i1.p1  ORF type:complete len:404 (-),score=68.46 TRINITY_DN32263_c0_g1_i1:454-1665(-)